MAKAKQPTRAFSEHYIPKAGRNIREAAQKCIAEVKSLHDKTYDADFWEGIMPRVLKSDKAHAEFWDALDYARACIAQDGQGTTKLRTPSRYVGTRVTDALKGEQG